MPGNWLLDFLPRIAGALAILIIGYILARIIARAVIRFTDRTGRLDDTLKPVIPLRYSLRHHPDGAGRRAWAARRANRLAPRRAGGSRTCNRLGAAGNPFQHRLGANAVVAASIPGRRYIATSAVAGTVEEVQLFSTRIRTWDGVNKFVPNSTLWSTTITNYSRNPTRLILIEFGLAYENEISKGREILAEVAPNTRKSSPSRRRKWCR